MSSMIGERLRISIFGQSHGEAIGVVMDGVPAGEAIDAEELQRFLARRAPGRNEIATPRQETDVPQFLSGIVGGVTCEAPLCAIIKNEDTRSGDYKQMQELMRPSHADYPAQVRYGGHRDVRGGGHFSGRLTAPLCIAGGIAKQILARRGIFVGAHIETVGNVNDRRFSSVDLTQAELFSPLTGDIPLLDKSKAAAVQSGIAAVRAEGDSVGGIIECAVIGVPAGIGDPMFGGMENRLAAMLFGVPGMRGIEFGAGFAAAAMRGSQHNDSYRMRGGEVRTETNNHGGILGGITTGMPLIFRVAMKPTPSIACVQKTVNIVTGEDAVLSISGRHDPCIAIRAVPCIEAAAALVILDAVLTEKGKI